MKENNKKGFTLIELLAVIVILAIIALIAVPIILNILTKARKSAAQDTAYSILNAAELYYAEALLDNPTQAFAEKTFSFPNGASELKVKGTKPTEGSVILAADGTAKIGQSLKINNLLCSQSGNEVKCN